MPSNKENLIFEREPLLTGRTQIESNMKINTDDFDYGTDNTLALKNKTSYWSCTGVNFVEEQYRGGVSGVAYNNAAGIVIGYTDNSTLYCPVFLPHGAVITGCIVSGDAGAAAGITWTLYRTNLSTGEASALASASVDTEDTSITNAEVDNENYGYYIATGTDEMDTGDEIYGARISYTTDYD